jgi:hypothetical protein
MICKLLLCRSTEFLEYFVLIHSTEWWRLSSWFDEQ